MGHSKTDSWGGHRMLSFFKKCQRITDSRVLCLLFTLSLLLAVASTLTEAIELKRAGFVGMRGKKSNTIEDQSEEFYENNPQPLFTNKRQGFVGMRGKKGQPHFDTLQEAMQRIGRAGFVGM